MKFKVQLSFVMLILLAVIMVVEAGLAIYFVTETKRDYSMIDVKLEEGKDTYYVEFSGLGLIPGDQTQFTLNLKGHRDVECDVSLAFSNNDEALTLKDFVYVKVSLGDEVLCDKLLADLFEEEEIKLKQKFKEGEKYQILITYYMPVSVGDEAQNAEACFDLVIKITNSEEFYE